MPSDILEKAEMPNDTSKKRRRWKKANNTEGHNYGRWGASETKLFFDALAKYGKDYKQIEKHIKTRTQTQIRGFGH